MDDPKPLKPGPDKVDFNWDVLNTALQFKATKITCAQLMGVSIETVLRRIKEEHGCTFVEYRQRFVNELKLRLQQKAIQQAMSGNSALMIFCLKNICKWDDQYKHAPVQIKEFKFVGTEEPEEEEEEAGVRRVAADDVEVLDAEDDDGGTW